MSIIYSQRRTFLKAAGLSIALPALQSARLGLAQDRVSGVSGVPSPPTRMVCVGNEFGMYPEAFWPATTGKDYKATKLLEPLEPFRDRYSLLAGLDHGLKGGHFAVHTFLTGVNSADARHMPEGGISLDQRAAESVGSQTRFPSLAVGSDNGIHGGPMMSWTRTGTRVPPIAGPSELFQKLFIEDSRAARAMARDRISLRHSILDSVLDDASSLKRRLNKADADKLDEYFSSVRSVERKLDLDLKWQRVPKPPASIEPPEDEGLTRDMPKIYDLIALALQTDSTRVVTLEIGGSFAVSDLGIRSGYHSLSHHGKDAKKIDQLTQIELYQIEQLSRFLSKLSSLTESQTDSPLIDNTMVLMGSGMGNANSHTNNNLPVILAGGSFKHIGHRRFGGDASPKVPLSNLFVTMLQRFGIPTDSFSQSTGTLTGLDSSV